MDTGPTTFTDAKEEQPAEIRQRLAAVCDAAKESRLRDWFVPRHDSDGRSLETIFREWLSDDNKYMLRIRGEAGAGKTTLKDFLFLQLAEVFLRSESKKIPVEMGFAAAVIAVTRSASGRLEPRNDVIFVDGHEGRLAALEGRATVRRGTKVVVLQRDTFIRPTSSVTRLRKASAEVDGCTTIWLKNLTLAEARIAIERFFPIALEEIAAKSKPLSWKEERLSALLSGAFDGLLVSPAMAHRLSRLAADPNIEMGWNQDEGRWTFRSESASSRF